MREIILRVKFQRPASRRSLAARVEHCHWSEYVGMSLQERQVTMQVMLGTARWLSTCEFSCASSVSDSFCRVDTPLTETICEFLATVESRLADSFLSRGYGREVCLSGSLRVLSATSKRFYSARNSRQFQHVEVHGATL